MNEAIKTYHEGLVLEDKAICDQLYSVIDKNLSGAENKIWHRHPVWFIEGNPIVGYSRQKTGIRLMFWSGADFEDSKLQAGTGKFKDASVFYQSMGDVNESELISWLVKAKSIQWDYKNIVKRKGQLLRLQ